MSIATELTLLANSKQAIKNSINAKGGSITDSTPFADYSTAIDNLPSGGDDSTLRDLIERDITSITIPSGTTRISDYTFYYCRNLTSVTIPSGVTEIGLSAFSNCQSLASVSIPNTVTIIQGSAFETCGLTSVSLPNISWIKNRTFYQCASLTSVNIPNTVTTIDNAAFYGCISMKSFTIPSSVTSLNGGTFQQCNHLESLVFLGTTPPTLDRYSTPFGQTNDCPIYVPSASVAAYKAADRWSLVESRIYAIAQVATVDNTPVYNYDLGMTSTTMITSTNMQKMPTGTSLELAEGIVDAGGSFGNYTSITLPSTFSSFDDQGMIGNTTTTLTCLATTPPTAERNNLGGANLTAIYVPAANVADYQANATWSSFSSIIQAIPSE